MIDVMVIVTDNCFWTEVVMLVINVMMLMIEVMDNVIGLRL